MAHLCKSRVATQRQRRHIWQPSTFHFSRATPSSGGNTHRNCWSILIAARKNVWVCQSRAEEGQVKNETKELKSETETIMRNKTEWNWIIYQLWSGLLTTSTAATLHMYAKWQLKLRTHEIKDEIRHVDKRDEDGNGDGGDVKNCPDLGAHLFNSIRLAAMKWNMNKKVKKQMKNNNKTTT